MEPITVMLVDDHSITREGLRAMLETDQTVRVVGEAASGVEALAGAAELRPSVVLMDIKMPDMDGLEATRRLKAAHPTIAVIMLTNYDDAATVVDSMRAGASGYLLKDASRDLLLHSIAAVVSGGVLVNPALLRKALSSFVARPPSSAQQEQNAVRARLTDRDLVVLHLLAEGKTNKEIGETLNLAEITVKKIVQAIVAKLRASDRTHAAITAMRLGLIE